MYVFLISVSHVSKQLLLFDEVKSRGVLRPMQPEVYDPSKHLHITYANFGLTKLQPLS
jgi:hypothetical protein